MSRDIITQTKINNESLKSELALEEELKVNDRISNLRNLVELEDEKKSIQDDIHDIYKKIKFKETIISFIKKLEYSINDGVTIDELQLKLNEKKTLLIRKTKELETNVKVLNDTNLDYKLIKLKEIKEMNYIKFKQGTLLGKTKSVITCLVKINNSKVASGCGDGSIQIWDLISGNCLNTLTGHIRLINYLEKLSENRIASASQDNTIKVFDLVTGICMTTLAGHNNSVFDSILCIAGLNDNQLASGNQDNTIQIWDL